MLNYIEYLNMPTKIALILVGILLVIQIVGEILEFKGKIVPEFMKIRKYFARKKKEREALSHMTDLLKEFRQTSDTLKSVKNLLNNVDKHYSDDNITKRNQWIKWVNDKANEYDTYGECIAELKKQMKENTEITLSLLIDGKRSTIIDFASKVIDENYPVTREQFNRIFKAYKEYEDIIDKNNLTNGEIDIAYRIISESYENHMRNHTFVEDIRGYDI